MINMECYENSILWGGLRIDNMEDYKYIYINKQMEKNKPNG